jgi:hypothetical protein
VSEQRLEPSEIALLGGREEPLCQLVALLAGRVEAGPALLDVASGAGGELAHVVLALADDRRDLRILCSPALRSTPRPVSRLGVLREDHHISKSHLRSGAGSGQSPGLQLRTSF